MSSNDRRLTPESVVFDRASAGQPALSPDGTVVAYVVTTPIRDTGKSTSQVWMVGIDGNDAQQLSRSGDKNLGPVWSPDGCEIAYVSVRDGDKPNCLVVIPVAGGESRIVSRFQGMPADLAWDPKGGRIAFTMVPDPEDPEAETKANERAPKVRVFSTLNYKADGRGFLIGQTRQILIATVEDCDVRQLTTGDEEHVQPQWSPDGKWISVRRPQGAGVFQQMALIEVATGERRAIDMPGWMCATRAWSPNGSSIAFFGNEGWKAQPGLYRYDIAGDSIESIAGEVPFYADIFASEFGWIDAGTIVTSGFLNGRSGIWSIDCDSGAITELFEPAGFRIGYASNRDASAVVQLSWSRDSHGELAVWNRKSGKLSIITDINASFRNDHDAPRVECATITRAGETIEYWVTYPPDFDPEGLYPVVLHIHGGPHGFFWDGTETTADTLASTGKIVISPNPRGSGSYGAAFAEAVINDWGGEDWLDDLAVLDAVLEHPYADASRTGIIGYSYGGFVTSWAIGQTDRFKAAVCGAPVFNFVSFRGTSDIGPDFFAMQWDGEWPDNRDLLEAHSPSTYIHRAVTPTLVVVGDEDHRCPAGQAEELFAGLIGAGVQTELVRYPGGSHGTIGGEPLDHAVDYHTRAIAWFDRFL